MAKLIGNEPNQVPTNGDLGKLAFQEPEAVNITGGTLDSVTVTNLTTDGASLDGAVVINESGADVDFRVESNNNSQAIFVDAANDKVSLANDANITSNTNTNFYVDSTAFGSSMSPVWIRNRPIDTLAAKASFGINLAIDGRFDSSMSRQQTSASGMALVFENNSASNAYGWIGHQTLGGTNTSPIHFYSDGVVVNQNSADIDFRVESDTNTHALFVNAGNSRVGINDGAPESTLHVRSAGTAGLDLTQALTVEGYGTGNSGDAACIAFAAGDATRKGAITFTRNNSYGRGYMSFLVDGAADSNVPTTSEEVMRINSNSVVINENSNDIDFRVESDTHTHALFVDASSNRIGLFSSSPQQAITFDASAGGIFEYRSGTQAMFRPSTNDNDHRLVALSNNGLDVVWGGTTSTSMQRWLNGTGVVFNEGSVTQDFRVESNNNTHALYVDAGNDRVTLGGLVVVDSENASNRARSQTITGQATAAASGTSMKFVRTGHSGVFDVQIFVSHPSGVSSGSGMYQGTFCMAYGAGGLKSTPCTQYYNTVTGISVGYNNGGSPAYTLDVTVTYTGTAPIVYWTVTGKTDVAYTLENLA